MCQNIPLSLCCYWLIFAVSGSTWSGTSGGEVVKLAGFQNYKPLCKISLECACGKTDRISTHTNDTEWGRSKPINHHIYLAILSNRYAVHIIHKQSWGLIVIQALQQTKPRGNHCTQILMNCYLLGTTKLKLQCPASSSALKRKSCCTQWKASECSSDSTGSVYWSGPGLLAHSVGPVPWSAKAVAQGTPSSLHVSPITQV